MTDVTLSPLTDRFDRVRVERRLHGVPPHEVFLVEIDGRRGVFKRSTSTRGRAGMEGAVTRTLDRHTSVPVPRVLVVGDDWFLTAWEPAAPDPDAGAAPDTAWAERAGRELARLHDETAAWTDRYGRFSNTADGLACPSHDDWQAAAVAFCRDVRSVAADHGHGEVIDDVIRLLASDEDLCAGVGEPVVCHGWVTPEHLSVERRSCFVDFEHAIAAPAGFDYWRTALVALDDEPRRAFRTGYESVRPLPAGVAEREPLYRLLTIVYFFESLYVQDQHPPAETARRADRVRSSLRDLLADLERR